MKYTTLFCMTLLIGSIQTSYASNPMSEMMGTASDMMGTASDMMKSGSDAAINITDSAKEVLTTDNHAAKVINIESGKASQLFRWSYKKIEALKTGDANKGKQIAKTAKCAKCHGDTGISDEDDTPSIAGQIAAYTYKQLHDYQTKLRDDRSMYKKVKSMSDQDFIDLAAWYATQTPEKMAGNAKGNNIPVLADKGDPKRFLLACNACHNEEAMKRGLQTPIIEGQKPEHFVDTMMAFKEGERINDHYRLMRSIASRLTDEEIEELAEYYSVAPSE